ncbi:MAG: hypothetical protein ACYC9S_13115 [Leptospirales bacterium]
MTSLEMPPLLEKLEIVPIWCGMGAHLDRLFMSIFKAGVTLLRCQVCSEEWGVCAITALFLFLFIPLKLLQVSKSGFMSRSGALILLNNMISVCVSSRPIGSKEARTFP